MKKIVKSVCLLAMAVFVLSCNNNTEAKHEDTKDVAQDQNDKKFESPKDNGADFLVDAASINMEEIQLGQLAQSMGTAPDVKSLGKMMETEHKSALEEIKTLAASKSISLPEALTDEAQNDYKKLMDEKKGHDFDKKFCDMMVDGHEKAIKKFEHAAENVEDADVKALANKMLPTLRTHLEHSKACKDANDKEKHTKS